MTSRLPVLALFLVCFPGRFMPRGDPPDCARLVASGASADLYCIPLIPAPGYRRARIGGAGLGSGPVHRRRVAGVAFNAGTS